MKTQVLNVIRSIRTVMRSECNVQLFTFTFQTQWFGIVFCEDTLIILIRFFISGCHVPAVNVSKILLTQSETENVLSFQYH